jgi:hypothetical protein
MASAAGSKIMSLDGVQMFAPPANCCLFAYRCARLRSGAFSRVQVPPGASWRFELAFGGAPALEGSRVTGADVAQLVEQLIRNQPLPLSSCFA